jgi:hypothetical protein
MLELMAGDDPALAVDQETATARRPLVDGRDEAVEDDGYGTMVLPDAVPAAWTTSRVSALNFGPYMFERPL